MMAQSLVERSKCRLRLEIAKQMAGISEQAPQRKCLHLASEPTDAFLSPTLQDITNTSETSPVSSQVDDFEDDLYVPSPDSSVFETLDLNVSDDSKYLSVPECSDFGTCSSEVLYSESDESDSSVDDFAQASSSTTPCSRNPMFPGSKITPNELKCSTAVTCSKSQSHVRLFDCYFTVACTNVSKSCSPPTSNDVLTKMFVDYPK